MKKILVIQTGKLGDMVCTTPVFRAIKSKYPGSKLYVSGDAVNKQVLGGNPYIDEYIVIPELDAKLKEEKFDASILLNPHPGILWKLIKSQRGIITVPKVVGGFSPYQTKIYRLLSLFVTPVPHRMREYAPGEYLRGLKSIGIFATDTTKDVFIEGTVLETIEKFLLPQADKPRVAITPSAGNKIKEWPPEKFAEVADALITDGAHVYIVGGEQDINLAQEMIKHMRKSDYTNTTGRLSIEELKALIKKINLFISADTGPIYIAEALGVPTVDIVGPVDENVQPPRGPKNLVVLPPDRKRSELFIMNARVYDKVHAELLATSTRVEDVLEAAQKLLLRP